MQFTGQFLLVFTFITLHIGHYWAVRYFLDSELAFLWLTGKLTLYGAYFLVGASIAKGVWLACKKGLDFIRYMRKG